MRALFEETKRERAVRLVTIIGEAGMGKSRIVAELRAIRDTRAVMKAQHSVSVNISHSFEFELSPAVIGIPVHLRMGDYQDRWTATVRCGSTTTDGLGATAREALVAALAPLGSHLTTLLMAQPVMFAASADLLARSELVPA